MKYDFETVPVRKDATAFTGVGSGMWGMAPDAPDPGYSFIPMWVADMNFAAAPSVVNAMKERLEDMTFGYFSPSKEYYDAIIRWQTERNHVTGLEKKNIGYENGVHGLVCSAIQTLTEPGDPVLLQRPYYAAFENDITGNGRKLVFSDLVQDADGTWKMDCEELDRVLRDTGAKLAVFCSPHNPTGRVWTRTELEEAMDVFRAHDCTVVSDEIWSDLVFDGREHVPAQTVNDWAREHVIAAYAPSKTFNLAGLIGSYHIIYNNDLRRRIREHEAKAAYNEMNVMSMYALIGAYNGGAEWVGELKQVLYDNCRYAFDRVKSELPGVDVQMPEGTYMMFLDCSGYMEKTGRTIEDVLHSGWRVGVGWEDGRIFGGPHHIRINLALPRSLETEAFDRMRDLVFL